MSKVKSSSQLVLYQFAEIYEVNEPMLKKYFVEGKNYVKEFCKVKIEHIPREANEEVDYLARMSLTSFKEESFRLCSKIELDQSSYKTSERNQATLTVKNIEEEKDNWQTPLKIYLLEDTLLEDKKEAKMIKSK